MAGHSEDTWKLELFGKIFRTRENLLVLVTECNRNGSLRMLQYG